MGVDLKEKKLKKEFHDDKLNKPTDNKLKLKFNLSVIELLGSQLYTKLPSIISEFVSNSYDADATEVEVIINENNLTKPKTINITIKDTGIAS